MNLELQQRSVEYFAVLKNSADGFREGLFACMPVFAPSSNFLSEGDGGDVEDAEVVDQNGGTSIGETTPKSEAHNLLDLLGDTPSSPQKRESNFMQIC